EQTVHVADNIFYSYAPIEGHWSGDFYLMANYGHLQLETNWVPSWTQMGSVTSVSGMENLVWGEDPGFVDVQANDFRLTEDSACRRIAISPLSGLEEFEVQYQYDVESGTWVYRDTAHNLGAIESGLDKHFGENFRVLGWGGLPLAATMAACTALTSSVRAVPSPAGCSIMSRGHSRSKWPMRWPRPSPSAAICWSKRVPASARASPISCRRFRPPRPKRTSVSSSRRTRSTSRNSWCARTCRSCAR